MSIPVSVCMIARDEEKMLDISLGSIDTGIFHEIILVDTGSTDSTVAVATKKGAKIHHYDWINDFSAARNYAAAMAQNDWILVLDADEEITDVDTQALQNFLTKPDVCGSIVLVEKLDNAHNHLVRLYNKKTHMFSGKIHEQIVPLKGNIKIENMPIKLLHHGYLPEYGKTDTRINRNESMIKEEIAQNPNDPYLLYQLGKCYFFGGRDFYRASVYFEDALSKEPSTDLSYVYNLVECLGYSYVNSGKSVKALDLYKKYKPLYWTVPSFRFLTAHIYQENGMFSEAVECYESCLNADVEDYRGITGYASYYNIGVILEVAGLPDKAKNFYEACGDYAPAKSRLMELE